jgi:predicted small lipoprotein YifL
MRFDSYIYKNNLMKSFKIFMTAALVISAICLSSCGKKGFLKPDDKKAKHGCNHQNEDSSETTAQSGT